MGTIIFGLFLCLLVCALAAIVERDEEIRARRAAEEAKTDQGKAPAARRWKFPRSSEERVNPTAEDMQVAGEFFVKMLRVECAWCGKVLQEGAGGPASHGICGACSWKHFKVRAEEGSGR